MKPFILLIVLIHSGQLMGQPYLNETSRWEQVFRISEFPGITTIDEMFIHIDGDTVIGSTIYHRMLKTGTHKKYYDDPQKGDTLINEVIHEYMDPIREEGKMFIAYNRAEQNEYIMYDFSGSVGDTLLSNDCERDTIESIDTLYLGAEPRKQFHLPEYSPGIEFSTLIEGVGSTFGFGHRTCNTAFWTVYYLKCYYQDGNHIQIYPNFGPCEFVLSVDPVQDAEFSIYPNPFTDEIEIHFANDFQQSFSMSIANLVGTFVFEKRILPQSSVEHISLPQLAAGMYVVFVHTKEGIRTQKMIKQ